MMIPVAPPYVPQKGCRANDRPTTRVAPPPPRGSPTAMTATSEHPVRRRTGGRADGRAAAGVASPPLSGGVGVRRFVVSSVVVDCDRSSALCHCDRIASPRPTPSQYPPPSRQQTLMMLWFAQMATVPHEWMSLSERQSYSVSSTHAGDMPVMNSAWETPRPARARAPHTARWCVSHADVRSRIIGSTCTWHGATTELTRERLTYP